MAQGSLGRETRSDIIFAMAKLQGPLLSAAAHGKIANQVIFSRRKGNNIARGFHMPKKDISLSQWTQRHIIGMLVAHWQCMTDAQRQNYENLAKESGLRISGFNYFLKVAQKDLYTHHGLCGYWSMNEISGDQVLDYSGQGNHGTLGPSYPSDCPVRVDSFQKEYGKMLQYDGVNDRVIVDNAPSLNPTAAITLMAWIFPTEVPNEHWRIIDKRYLKQWEIHLNPTAPPIWTHFTAMISGNSRGVGFETLALNQWYHIAGTYDGDRLRIYQNGILKSTSPSYPGTLDVGTEKLGIGCNFLGGENFGGYIDEVRIYNRALSAEEIRKHYELLRLGKKRQPLLEH